MKKADKGSTDSIMSPEFYWNKCRKYLSITEYYEKVMYSLRTTSQKKSDDYIQKYKEAK